MNDLHLFNGSHNNQLFQFMVISTSPAAARLTLLENIRNGMYHEFVGCWTNSVRDLIDNQTEMITYQRFYDYACVETKSLEEFIINTHINIVPLSNVIYASCLTVQTH